MKNHQRQKSYNMQGKSNIELGKVLNVIICHNLVERGTASEVEI
jgi:hypothetical protein